MVTSKKSSGNSAKITRAKPRAGVVIKHGAGSALVAQSSGPNRMAPHASDLKVLGSMPYSRQALGRGNADKLIDELRKGFAISVFEKTSRAIDIPIVALARITNIPPRTWARRKREGRLEQIESERLLRIIRLFEQATVVLGNVDQARTWIKSPKKAFRGKTPLEYADTEVGAREVEDLLGRLDHGVFS